MHVNCSREGYRSVTPNFRKQRFPGNDLAPVTHQIAQQSGLLFRQVGRCRAADQSIPGEVDFNVSEFIRHQVATRISVGAAQ
jgi:hypothetical protein